jgi:hypothetical protein
MEKPASQTPPELVFLMEHLSEFPVTHQHIKMWTWRDQQLALILQYLWSGWPNHCRPNLQPYNTSTRESSYTPGVALRAPWHRQNEVSQNVRVVAGNGQRHWNVRLNLSELSSTASQASCRTFAPLEMAFAAVAHRLFRAYEWKNVPSDHLCAFEMDWSIRYNLFYGNRDFASCFLHVLNCQKWL